jgi:hypothetical protein
MTAKKSAKKPRARRVDASSKASTLEATSTPPAQQTCFTIMPFGGWFDSYYSNIYAPAIEAAGLKAHRADDLYRPSAIVHDIWSYTKKSRVVLADLTGKNANVFYELGLAHALAKPVVLVAQSIDDVPFDLRALRVIQYDKNAPDWGQLLGGRITTSIREVLEAPESAVLPAFLNVVDAPEATTVTADEKQILELRQEMELLRQEVRRSSIRRHGYEADVDGPDEARSEIKKMRDRGYPNRVIESRLVHRGVPRDWLKRELLDRSAPLLFPDTDDELVANSLPSGTGAT